MNIADLFVRVRGDTSDFDRKSRGVVKSMGDMGAASLRTEGGLRKVETALASYASRALGANAVTKELSLAMSGMALGGGVTTGILLGVGGIIAIYSKLTEATRKAAAEQKRLTEALAAQFAPKTGPRSATNKEFQAALQARADLTKQLGVLQTNREDPLVANSFIGRHIVDRQIEDVQKKLIEVNQAISDAYAGSITKLETVTATASSGADKVAGKFGALREEAAKVNAEMMKSNKDWWRNYIDKTAEAEEETKRLAQQIAVLTGTDTKSLVPPVDITPDVQVAGANAQAVTDAVKEQTRILHDAISSAATTIGSIVASAIGIIGNSRGNQIGGGIGAAVGTGIGSYIGQQLTTKGGAYIGGALGATVGSIVPVVGTIVGGLLGSALGGLFGHHDRSVDNNTRALEANTAVMSQLLNAPSGFKAESYRFDATHVRGLSHAVRQFDSRGGAPVFGKRR